jgi:hypothetical protein
VSAELLSQQGISLGRATHTRLRKHRPLIARVASALVLGPWRALGLLGDSTTVTMTLFDGFSNPAPPPAGWASLPNYRRFWALQQQQQLAAADYAGSSGGGGGGNAAAAAADDGDEDAAVPGPRALWLKVTLAGRPDTPRVYAASVRVDQQLGECVLCDVVCDCV